MKNQCVMLVGLVLAIGSMVGCASRTGVTLGPVQVAGQVQVFETPQAASFELSLNRVGFTIGQFGCEIESFVGPCEKVISLEHSTGDSDKVLGDSK